MLAKRNKIYRCMLVCLLFCVVSACSPFENGAATENRNNPSNQLATPVPTSLGIKPPVCRDANCNDFSPLPEARSFPDTWEDIHLFQTFDHSVEGVQDLQTIAQYNHFVWGARPENVPTYRQLNPNLMLSYYITYHRDTGSYMNTDLWREHSLDYWKNTMKHPDWILYKCDRVTPAYEYGDLAMPFASNNQEMFEWQLETYVKPAHEAGYDGIAVDNLNMENLFEACGYYDKSGNWVQRYSGQAVDPQWQADVLDWTTKMRQALRALPRPMFLFANFSTGAVVPTHDMTRKVVEQLDGVLDERGFTQYGDGYVMGADWLQMIRFYDSLQQQNKPVYLINEFWSDHEITPDDVQWVVGSYLLCKQRMAMVYIAFRDFYGRNSYRSEYANQVGSPSSEMYHKQNAYWRDYTQGQVIVNPSPGEVTVTLENADAYLDFYGKPVESQLKIPPHAGRILLKKS